MQKNTIIYFIILIIGCITCFFWGKYSRPDYGTDSTDGLRDRLYEAQQRISDIEQRFNEQQLILEQNEQILGELNSTTESAISAIEQSITGLNDVGQHTGDARDLVRRLIEQQQIIIEQVGRIEEANRRAKEQQSEITGSTIQ